MKLRALMLTILLAGCAAPVPITPQDAQARKFEALPDKAVIYLVRDNPDHNRVPATLVLDDSSMFTNYPGTYYRWEVDPGRHQIRGYGVDNGMITLQVEAGKIYYVQHRTSPWAAYALSDFQPVADTQGRSVVARSVLIGGR